MVKILSLMKIQLGKVEDTYKALQKYPEVKEILVITGNYDIAVMLESDSGEKLHELFATELDQLEWIVESNSNLVMKQKFT